MRRFTALPGGQRDGNAGYFGDLNRQALFWSSTSDGTSNSAWNRHLVTENPLVNRNNGKKQYGWSIR